MLGRRRLWSRSFVRDSNHPLSFAGQSLHHTGVKEAHMEILGGMMPLDDAHRERNLQRAYELGKGF